MASRQSVIYSAIHIYEVPLEGGVKLLFKQFNYEPRTPSVFDQIRECAARAGLTMEQVENLARDMH